MAYMNLRVISPMMAPLKLFIKEKKIVVQHA